MSADMSFWSVHVKGGETSTVEVEQTLGVATYLHVCNIALAGTSDTHSVISVTVNGTETVIATLSKSQMQYHTDLLLDSQAIFKVTGKVAVHITGYITYASMEDEDEEDERAFMGGMDDEDEDEDLDEAEEEEYDEDEDGEDEDEDDDEVPQGVPIVQGRQIKPTKRPTAASLFEEAAMDDGDDDGEDEDEGEYELNSDDVIGDFDDDEDEDEEEEEEEKPAAASGKKRGAEAVTPVPSKKPKVEEKKIPASAPPKMQEQKKAAEGGAKAPPKTPETPGDAGAYEAALVKFLSSQPGKKASLSDAGQAIKRPAGVKSLSKFVSDKKKFKVDDKTISLA